MPLTDDEFVKNNKSDKYLEIMNQLHEEEDKMPEMTYEFDDEDDDDQ